MGEIIDFTARKNAREGKNNAPLTTPRAITRPDTLNRSITDELVSELGIKIPPGGAILDDNLVRLDGFDMSFAQYRAKVEGNMKGDKEADKDLRNVVLFMETLVATLRVQAVEEMPHFTRDHIVALHDVAVDTYTRGLEYEHADLIHVGVVLLTKAYGPARAGRIAENIKIKFQMSKQ